MIKHIVMWKMKEQDNKVKKQENMIQMKEKLESLKTKVPELYSLEVGINISESERAFDVVLCSEFKTLEDLDVYRVHPEHKKVVEFILSVVKDTKAVDYEV